METDFRKEVIPPHRQVSRFYLRLKAKDEPVFCQVGNAFGDAWSAWI